MAKISGPLLDRIDIHIEVPGVSYKELAGKSGGTSSHEMREQVMAARQRQTERFAKVRTRYNAQMSSREVREFCQLDRAGLELLKQMVGEFGMSARAYDKVLRVARTIADLESAARVSEDHIQEAINYRLLDRQYWQS